MRQPYGFLTARSADPSLSEQTKPSCSFPLRVKLLGDYILLPLLKQELNFAHACICWHSVRRVGRCALEEQRL